MRVLENVGNEVLPTKDKPLVGTYHPVFYYSENKNGEKQTNPKSTAFVSKSDILINI